MKNVKFRGKTQIPRNSREIPRSAENCGP